LVDDGEGVDLRLDGLQPFENGVQQIDGRGLLAGEEIGALPGGEGKKVGHGAFWLEPADCDGGANASSAGLIVAGLCGHLPVAAPQS